MITLTMSRTCDWCGELEPTNGSFDSTDEEMRSMQTVLCPQHSPDSDVERGIFILYSFTAHRDRQTVAEAVHNYIESIKPIDEFKLIQDVGANASMGGHSRYALVIDIEDGLAHYKMRDILHMTAVIDSANGDPERNNCSAKFYNYSVDDVISLAEEPTVVYDSKDA